MASTSDGSGAQQDPAAEDLSKAVQQQPEADRQTDTAPRQSQPGATNAAEAIAEAAGRALIHERQKQFGTCEVCGDEIEQELWAGVWCPSECGKCNGERRRREEDDAIAKLIRDGKEEVLKRRIENSGVKRPYKDGKLNLRSYDPASRTDRKEPQLAAEKRAMVACEEWVKGLHPLNDQGEEQRGLYLFGKPGLGKSHYAQAALIAAINRGSKGLYVKFGELLADARDAMFAEDSQSERAFLKPFIAVDCLVIDDLGAMEKASEFTLRVAYALIEGRMSKNGRTIITANYNLTGLRARLLPKDTDPIEADRILDRILEYCEMIEFTGESYR
jgi:DNA replication protein DnaC